MVCEGGTWVLVKDIQVERRAREIAMINVRGVKIMCKT